MSDGSPLSPEARALHERYRWIQAQVGPLVTVVAATKHVSIERMGLLVEAGIDTVGENLLDGLEEKRARYAEAFRWHFIGRLQSRKAPRVSTACELVHSLDSLRAARRLSAPALVEVNLSGEGTKSGVSPRELAAFLTSVRELGVEVRGLMTMPPLSADPERSRPCFRELRLLAGEHGLAQLSMGTSQDFRVAVEEGATIVRVGSILVGR